MDTDADTLMWPEEVAAYLGYERVRSVRQEVYVTRTHIRTEGQARPTDLPLPVQERQPHQVPAAPPSGMKSTQTTRTVLASRWRLGDLDAMQEARRQFRADLAASRVRDASGRIMPRAS